MNDAVDIHSEAQRADGRTHKELLRDIVEILFEGTLPTMIVAVVGGIVMTIVLWGTVPDTNLVIWLIAHTTIYITRLGVSLYYFKFAKIQDIQAWKITFLTGAFLSGATWGSAALIIFPESSLQLQALLALVICIIAAGSVSAFAVMISAGMLFVIPMMFPIMFKFMFMGGMENLITGTMIGLYFLVVLWTSVRVNRSVLQSLKLRYQNQDLIKYLTQAKNLAEETNKDLEKMISEANRQAAIAQDANKAKSAFLANISHEIRTPLNGIIGMTELAMDGPLSDEQQEYLQTISKSADTLLQLVEDILDFSVVETQALELKKANTDLNILLRDMANLFEAKLGDGDLKLEWDVSDDVPKEVMVDPGRLRQVLCNLVDNALKFTQEGSITIAVTRAGIATDESMLKFSVSDTGIGIPEEKYKVIFDSFVQVNGSSTREFGGTGLGLAISRELVRLMGGDIWVESEIGTGSTFHFTVLA